MKSINLIPAPRRAAKRRRVHLRLCTGGCAAWAVLALLAACVSHAVWHGEDPQAGDRLARVSEEMQRTERAMAGVRTQLTAAESKLRANQAIATQPDWSILLALLGQKVENDVVLKSCHVRPASVARGTHVAQRPDQRRAGARPQDAASQLPPEPPPYVLEASGLARSQTAANDFVIRLELTRLFSKVTLLDTTREPFLDKDAIAFRLQCVLNQSPVASQERPAENESAAADATTDANVNQTPGRVSGRTGAMKRAVTARGDQ
jgi:hypothetical protein